ncbi:MAG: SPOR domain-containing protein [Vicinamibacterales bacterium]
MAATSSDEDGFREIQLSGKQMFFLFMAATTVLVVAFMLGMLVGRGVRAEREEVASAETPSPVASAERSSLPTPDEADPRKAAPPAPPENDAKPEEPPVAVNRGNKTDAKTNAGVKAPESAPKAPEPAKPAPATKSAEAPKQVADAKPAVKAPEPKPAPPAPKAEAKPAAPAPPPPVAAPSAPSADRSGFAVQVAAVNARGEADAIAKRLSGKGYPAYVEVPKGSASTFRVRVGTYQTRHEAQDVADKLKTDEKFKPWVTR